MPSLGLRPWSLLALPGFLLTCLASPSAKAFCRTYTCQAEEDCAMVDGCLMGGKPLIWPRACISFSVQQDASPKRGITVEGAEAALTQAYATWTNVRCSDGKPVSIGASKLEPVACDQIEFNECDQNANIWVFRDEEWPYDDGGWTLAQTWVHFDTRDGKIYDADVEVNTARVPITVQTAAQREQFLAIATHEIGHVFGLDHTPDSNATMYATYSAFTDLSVLAPDDIAGICAVYPSTRKVGKCDLEPYNGLGQACGSKECEPEGCCATAVGRARSDGPWGALAAGMGALLIAARRRRR